MSQNELRVLFVGLGELEVPVFEGVADELKCQGIARTLNITWLARLASQTTEALEPPVRSIRSKDLPDMPSPQELGFSDYSSAADYDRDWHFASTQAKRDHAYRITSGLLSIFDEFQPDVVVSSVGGETTRVLTDAISRHRNISCIYYNAVPEPGRYVLMKRLDAPFVPRVGESDSYHPTRTDSSEDSDSGMRPTQVTADPGVAEILQRLRAQYYERQAAYPLSWPLRKSIYSITAAVKKYIPRHEKSISPEKGYAIVYPLHDERDFQVAVRERHAVPQSAFLTYVASTLPPGFTLYIKPHPEHLQAHHSIHWKKLLRRTNVEFLPAAMHPSEAIRQADAVLTLASSMGYEAIKQGVPVVTYGRPFYGRRGATIDVDDPRDLRDAIAKSVQWRPDPAVIEDLVDEVRSWSWPGWFTPLGTDALTVRNLSLGLADALSNISERKKASQRE